MIRIDNTEIKVATWQDVFIGFLKYIKDNQEFAFELILDNQNDLFGKEETIVKWIALKGLIDNNVDLTSRYKTFDGKVWDRVKNLTDDVFFIHINISASVCIARIVNIMNKINMPDNSVEIVLQGKRI